MPIYAYKCDSCGFAKDVLQKLSDPALSICPSCNVGSFKKQVTAAGFQLKGSGWYATDFKGGSKVAEAASSSDSSVPSTEPSTPAATSVPAATAAPVVSPSKSES
tara:strand:+ start:178 stop:492 length:315 start_codon:yes stop_codon:yes gene_type:complete